MIGIKQTPKTGILLQRRQPRSRGPEDQLPHWVFLVHVRAYQLEHLADCLVRYDRGSR